MRGEEGGLEYVLREGEGVKPINDAKKRTMWFKSA